MVLRRLAAAGLLIFGALLAYFVYSGTGAAAQFPFQFGLDLAGGTHLVYRADTSHIASGEVGGAMAALRDVIERRINVFGVSEPLIQVQRGGIGTDGEQRLIVELPGVTNISDAVAAIGETPTLDFKLRTEVGTTTVYESTGLTGQYLSRAQLQFASSRTGGLSNEPLIVLSFTTEGAERFRNITESHVGSVLGIFLDGRPISEPVIQEMIPNGEATITGNFTPDEARNLVRNLNFGALPVPIELVSSQSIGASLGAAALDATLLAGFWGIILVSAFLVLWYRLPGLVAVVALGLYVALSLAVFQLIPVTLTVAGLAAFILSIGMAVDANILIFERMKEELAAGKQLSAAISEGFSRAWLSIRDSNLSSIITGCILFWMGGTPVIKGFALVFIIGVLLSMFSAITVSRTMLIAIGLRDSKWGRALFMSGLS